MRTSLVAAGTALLGVTLFDTRREYGKKLIHFLAAAVRTSQFRSAARFLQELTYLATFSTFVFENGHFAIQLSKNRGDWIRTSDLCVPNAAL